LLQTKGGYAQQKAFDEAIAAAARAGFIQDAALANELAGDYFVSICDKYRPTYYLTRARDLYQEWGAHAKVDHLLEKHETLIKISSTHSLSKQSPALSHWLSGGDSKLQDSVDLDLPSGRSSTPQQTNKSELFQGKHCQRYSVLAKPRRLRQNPSCLLARREDIIMSEDMESGVDMNRAS
jgi:hypothetical protein